MDIKQRLLNAHDNFPIIVENPTKLFFDACEEISRLEYQLRRMVLLYLVDDQAWDREADADRILERMKSLPANSVIRG